MYPVGRREENRMRITIVGPGIMPIPPSGWGAVESLIWDYKLHLEQIPNVVVNIVNVQKIEEIICQVNNTQPDIVHIQYDNHFDIVPYLHCKNVVMTSHYGYIDSLSMRRGDGYWGIMHGFVRSPAKILALSPSIRQVYIENGCPPEKVEVVHNGANDDLFRYQDAPSLPNRSIYLAKIDYRKRQHVYQNLDFIDFVGNIADRAFQTKRPNYLGEWTKQKLYDNLTNYANLVLLSDGEAHPLVCCEALVAGLGLVVSRFASANLDTSLPWIDVIPDDKLNDLDYVRDVILENQKKSVAYRSQIREYALQHFTWKKVVKNYMDILHKWFGVSP